MRVVLVHTHVKPEAVDAFIAATLENARQSLREPGIARFDVLRQSDDPTRYLLVEAYRSEDAPARHQETKHYQVWRDRVAAMMAEPRSKVIYSSLYPPDGEM